MRVVAFVSQTVVDELTEVGGQERVWRIAQQVSRECFSAILTHFQLQFPEQNVGGEVSLGVRQLCQRWQEMPLPVSLETSSSHPFLEEESPRMTGTHVEAGDSGAEAHSLKPGCHP